MEKENDDYLMTLQLEVTKCAIPKITNRLLQSFGVLKNDSIIKSVFLVISMIQLHHKLFNNWASYMGKNKTCLMNFLYK